MIGALRLPLLLDFATVDGLLLANTLSSGSPCCLKSSPHSLLPFVQESLRSVMLSVLLHVLLPPATYSLVAPPARSPVARALVTCILSPSSLVFVGWDSFPAQWLLRTSPTTHVVVLLGHVVVVIRCLLPCLPSALGLLMFLCLDRRSISSLGVATAENLSVCFML